MKRLRNWMSVALLGGVGFIGLNPAIANADDAVYMYDLGGWGLMAQQVDDLGRLVWVDANGISHFDENGNYIETGNTTADVAGCHLHLRQYWDPNKRPTEGYHKMYYIHGGAWAWGRNFDFYKIDRSWNGNTPSYLSNLDNVIHYFMSLGYMVSIADYRLLRPRTWVSDGTYATGASGGGALGSGTYDADCGPATTAELKTDVKINFGYAEFMDAFFHDGDLVNAGEKTLIMGDSAGAHLAVWLGNQLSAEDKAHVAVVGNSGPYDFMNFGMLANTLPNGLDGVSDSALALRTWAYSATHIHSDLADTAAVDASANLTAFTNAFTNPPSELAAKLADELKDNTFQYKNQNGPPPMYLVAGKNDPTVPPQQAIIYCESLAAYSNTSSVKESDEERATYTCGANSKLDIILAATNQALEDQTGHEPSYQALYSRIDYWFSHLPSP